MVNYQMKDKLYELEDLLDKVVYDNQTDNFEAGKLQDWVDDNAVYFYEVAYLLQQCIDNGSLSPNEYIAIRNLLKTKLENEEIL